MEKSSTYQVLARKWRPQQFDDVVGQEHVTRTLKNAIAAGRVAHAYLFVGPRGTGKTTSARIFAKALNCEKGPTPTPCDACDACREIMAGTAMDVIEMDAASNTGVDYVRELRDNARYAPVRGPYKIYVIDEVHMLSTGAFNALLKTLEEPPPHVKFVLATTDPQKVPATIHSRCQRFDLRRISVPVIAGALRKIAQAEEVDIDDDALLAIARGAEGGMRDAQSAMDQLISFIGKTIREADVLSVFGLVSRNALEELASSVLQGDVPALIRQVSEFNDAGKDMQRLVLELMGHFRDVLICQYDPQSGAAVDLSGAHLRALTAQASQTTPGRVLQIFQILTETESRLRYALSRRILVETALIRCARAATVASLDELLKQVEDLKSLLTGDALAQPAPPVAEAAKKKSTDHVAPPAPPPEPEPESEPEPEPEPEPGPPEWLDPPDDLPGGTSPKELSPEQLVAEHQRLFSRWHDVIQQVGHVAPLVRNYLIDAKPLQVEATSVSIGFDPEFSSEMENVDVPHNRRVLEKTLGRFLDRTVTVHFKKMVPGDELPTDIHLPEGHTKPDPKAMPTVDEAALTAEQRWIREPAVRKALEIFNGEIIDIRE